MRSTFRRVADSAAQRNGERHPRAAVRDVVDDDVAAVAADDLSDDDESEPGPVGFRREERLEDRCDVRPRPAPSSVMAIATSLPSGASRASTSMRPPFVLVASTAFEIRFHSTCRIWSGRRTLGKFRQDSSSGASTFGASRPLARTG